jgi:XTP/dITP diphosphohydrolase
MKNVEARSAHFESVVAHFSAELKSPVCFHGEVLGEIAIKERRGNSRSGFGFDPIFKPLDSSKTFAEMTIAEKNEHSHRARALRKFAEWYKS